MTTKQLGYVAVAKVPSLPTPSSTFEGVILELSSDSKPYYCDGTQWIDLTDAGTGGGLSITPIKTANYTASVGELVRVDSSGGSFTVTLPAASDGAIVAVFDVTNSCDTHAVTVAPSSGKTVEGDAAGLLVDVEGAYVGLLYSASGTNWKIQDSFLPPAQSAVATDTLHPFLLMGA